MRDETFDLVVIGGGPAGSAVSSFVAMQKHRVLLLERERFPRYQIGESLLPVTVHGICRMLGVDEELKEANFMRKRGGTFRWGTRVEPWTFAFKDTWLLAGEDTGYAYQVERSRFDKLLLDNARRKGVDVREECAVTELLVDNGRVTGVEYTDDTGQRRTARARFVIDASGHRSQLHQHVGERIFSRFFQNVALYAYFENGKRLPPPNAGNILCAAFDQGWFWYIPLSDKLTSVGAVIAREHAEALQDGHEQAMSRFIDACPIIKDYLASATRVTTGQYGQFRVRKDYSYCNTKFFSPGFALIGDAACFIDPVFSSGVHLATYGALLAARSINTVLAGDLDEERCFTEFEQRYRHEYRVFYDFLVSFYDMHQDESSYFWKARKVLNTSEADNEAFIRLVSGGGTTADDFIAMRRGAGEFFHTYTEARMRDEDTADFFQHFAGQQFDAKGFLENLRRERQQILSQSLQGEARPAEKPLYERGLIPSTDGFHWRVEPQTQQPAA